jgi:tetratricopeptide (TPR) repeat protein
LVWVARSLHASPPLARAAAAESLPLLETVVRDNPSDLSARESLGLALGMLDRREDALRVYEEVLRIAPDRELTLRSSARVLNRLQRADRARSTLQKTIAVNPWSSDYHLALARVCYQVRDWPGVVAACGQAIRLNPELVEARSLLVQCYLRSQQPERADAEFQILLRWYPASRAVWERWYDQQKQAGPEGLDFGTTGEP